MRDDEIPGFSTIIYQQMKANVAVRRTVDDSLWIACTFIRREFHRAFPSKAESVEFRKIVDGKPQEWKDLDGESILEKGVYEIRDKNQEGR